MNITKIGDQYIIYDDLISSISKLDNVIYKVNFSKQFGLHLIKYADSFSITEKIFGDYKNKIDKSFKLFSDRNKSIGILMTGKKGMGKSFCAKELCNKCLENGYPVVLIDSSFDTNKIASKDIPEFFGKIKQDVVIFFDEFDKVFSVYTSDEGHNDIDPQEDLLSMFDGVDSEYKRLFIVTSNKTSDINEYFLNRPGRFHYHFRFSYPTEKEISDYIKYYCEEIDKKELEEIILFSDIHPLTYDCLSAVVTELNYGRKFKEFINDLNISSDTDEYIYSYTWVFGILNLKLDFSREGSMSTEIFEDIVQRLSSGEKRSINYDAYDNKNKVSLSSYSSRLNGGHYIIEKPLSYYKTNEVGHFKIPITDNGAIDIDGVFYPTFDGDRRDENDPRRYPIEKELGVNLMESNNANIEVANYIKDCIRKGDAYFEIKITKSYDFSDTNILKYLV